MNDVWVQNPSEVRREVVAYFTNDVTSPWWERPKLDGVPLIGLPRMRTLAW